MIVETDSLSRADALPGDDTARVDVWLWRARLFKSRSMASDFVRAGRVRVLRAGLTRRLTRASATLRPGDELTFARAGRTICVRVLDPGLRRGPAREAAVLYEPVDAQPGDEDAGTAA